MKEEKIVCRCVTASMRGMARMAFFWNKQENSVNTALRIKLIARSRVASESENPSLRNDVVVYIQRKNASKKRLTLVTALIDEFSRKKTHVWVLSVVKEKSFELFKSFVMLIVSYVISSLLKHKVGEHFNLEKGGHNCNSKEAVLNLWWRSMNQLADTVLKQKVLGLKNRTRAMIAHWETADEFWPQRRNGGKAHSNLFKDGYHKKLRSIQEKLTEWIKK